MERISSICVFCGASNNIENHFFEEGRKFGEMLAKNNIRLIYGGASCGIMGAIADGVLENGGKVTGVFPSILDGLEAAHDSLTEIITVDDMHTRKMTMFERSDAFVVFPGGFGTMDETFEVITWKQLETHKKPVIMYNYRDYWGLWIQFTEHIINNGFASKETRAMYEVVNERDRILEVLNVT